MLVLSVGAERGDGEDSGARAVAVARATLALQTARRDYAQSRFARCAERLEGAERLLRAHAEGAVGLELAQRLNLWAGLCHSVGGATETARRAFARAGRLPGPGPDPQVFPPAVMKLYRQVTGDGARRRCALKLDGDGKELRLDGRSAAAGELVEAGEHYASWRTSGPRADLVRVGEDCSLVLPEGVAGGAALTREEAGQPELLAAVGAAAGVERLVLVGVEREGFLLGVFDVRRGVFLARPALRASASALAAGRWIEKGRGQKGPDEPGGRRSTEERSAGRAWYTRWWVWTLVGAAVTATAVILPVALTSGRRYELDGSAA